jgi:hypothetical protein
MATDGQSEGASRPTRGLRLWAVSVLLVAPAAIPYVAHYSLNKPYSLPTGYIQPDMPLYAAKAREYFDPGAVNLTYSHPSSDSYDGPRIYFQPWTFALGAVHHLSGLAGGTVYVGFWLLAAICCARAAVSLYQVVVPLESPDAWRGLVAFFWGGGVLALSGAILALARHESFSSGDVFALDPFDGWWFLNFGRNLVYPTEALYHALFFLCIVLVLRRRWAWALAVAAVEAASTPFTGVELLTVLLVWSGVEVFLLGNRERHLGFLVGAGFLCASAIAYYAGFLNRYPEHRIVAAQMSLPWSESAATILAAEVFVGALAVTAIRRQWRAREFLASSRDRLLLVWFLVAFALSNHGIVLAPRQPIHFDRGYVWTPLFLLGAPTLVGLFGSLRNRLPSPWGRAAIALVLGLFLMDNIAWFVGFASSFRSAEQNGVRINRDQRDVLAHLDSRSYYGDLVLCQDRTLANLVLAETPLRTWTSHWLETPHFRARERELDALFEEGRFAAAWESRPLLIVFTRESGRTIPPDCLVARGAVEVYQNRKYQIYRIDGSARQVVASGDNAARRSNRSQ